MITVDWSIGGNTINYITARNRVGDVAVVINRLITFLFSHNYIRFEELHVIGHSLGYAIELTHNHSHLFNLIPADKYRV